MIQRMEGEIYSGMINLYQFSNQYDNYEESMPSYMDRSYLRHMLALINQYERAVSGDKFYNLKKIAVSYDRLFDLILNFGKIKPTIILNRSILRHLQPMGDLFDTHRAGEVNFEECVMDLNEKIEKSNSEDYYTAGYRYKTVDGLEFCINSELYDLLEEEGYKRIL